MKKFKYIALFAFVFLTSVFGQMRDDGPPPGRERIEQLEKIKLIEVLKMDEETTLRFFARRTEMKSKMDELNVKADTILEEMQKILEDEDHIDQDVLQSKINEWKKLHTQMERIQSEFIDSLYDILTLEQIAKMIVFEKRFRDELRRVLMHGKHHKMYQK